LAILTTLIVNICIEGPPIIDFICFFSTLHYLFQCIKQLVHIALRCYNPNFEKDEFKRYVGGVCLFFYLLVLCAVAGMIFIRNNFLYISPLMIFLGVSTLFLGFLIYMKMGKASNLNFEKKRIAAMDCIRLIRFALVINAGCGVFFYLYKKVSRKYIASMDIEEYNKKIAGTNWINRSKDDFINTLESDFTFYFYYSLASCVFVIYSGVTVLHWRRTLNPYGELHDDD
jgi:hypothetical protein